MEQVLKTSPSVVPNFWSTYSGAEIDLFLQKDGKKIGLEFKFSEAPKTTKSMHIAINDLSLEKLYIIYPVKEQFPLTGIIEACPLQEIISILQP